MTTVDIVLGLLLLLSGAVAFLRGFVAEVLGIAAWIGAAFAALYGLPLARPHAREIITISWAADAAAALLIFLVVLLLLSMVTRAISRMVQATGLNSLDRSLGFAFGLLRGALLASLAYLTIDSLWDQADHPAWLNEARSLPLLKTGADMIRDVIPEKVVGAARTTAQTAAEKGRQAMEAERSYRQLTQPLPQQTPTSEARQGEGGYRPTQRQDMNKLIDSTQ
ncbi:MAG: CvpA family protein [Alphaproteobacteria bacterium]|nr:CvpA family protein [Alphaproteobacteria bacterium]